MTFRTDDRVYETSVTTGVGDYALDGAVVGFTTFAGMGANNLCPYFATDDTNWEVGIGTILTGPARLQRTTILRSSNADAAVNWGAGTRKLRCGLPAAMASQRALSKSVAGGATVTLTQDEQRRDVLVFTGALTANINVETDATPWEWTVFNNTSGAFTLTLKTTAGSGKVIKQGKATKLRCDGTNVLDAIDSLTSLDGAVIATQADQETETSLTTVVSPGRQHFHPSAVKAAILAPNGFASLPYGYNVTSLTDSGTGRATVNLTVSFSSTNFAVAMGFGDQTGVENTAYKSWYTRATSNIPILVQDTDGNTNVDSEISVLAMGDL